jgi:hypothetical protein
MTFVAVWLSLEAVWNVSLLTFCYRFQPLTRWVNASRREWMRASLPKYARVLLANRYNRTPKQKNGSETQRRWVSATWQWFVCNKLGAIVTIPGKLALALWITGEKDGRLPEWVPLWAQPAIVTIVDGAAKGAGAARFARCAPPVALVRRSSTGVTISLGGRRGGWEAAP